MYSSTLLNTLSKITGLLEYYKLNVLHMSQGTTALLAPLVQLLAVQEDRDSNADNTKQYITKQYKSRKPNI